MKKYQIIVLVIILIVALYIYRSRSQQFLEVDLPPAQTYQDFEPLLLEEISNENEKEEVRPSVPTVIELVEETNNLDLPQQVEEAEIPSSLNLAVPFTSQAPTGNWEQPFQDACEEASVLMVDYYYGNKKFSTAESVEKMLIEMVSWQEENMRGAIDMDISEVAYFAKNYLGYDYQIINNPSIEDIKAYLNKGQPVIVPAKGKVLANPYFSNGGPTYHMLVIKGYVDGKFITNDPGTKRGADFIYTYQNLMSAIFDWDHESSSTTGTPKALVLFKKLSY